MKGVQQVVVLLLTFVLCYCSGVSVLFKPVNTSNLFSPQIRRYGPTREYYIKDLALRKFVRYEMKYGMSER